MHAHGRNASNSWLPPVGEVAQIERRCCTALPLWDMPSFCGDARQAALQNAGFPDGKPLVSWVSLLRRRLSLACWLAAAAPGSCMTAPEALNCAAVRSRWRSEVSTRGRLGDPGRPASYLVMLLLLLLLLFHAHTHVKLVVTSDRDQRIVQPCLVAGGVGPNGRARERLSPELQQV
ncbi:MAG: hypothetical protein INR71_11855 [Terriglobus roseus]|nr:hypothetical protein [Terriglobus roseus]